MSCSYEFYIPDNALFVPSSFACTDYDHAKQLIDTHNGVRGILDQSSTCLGGVIDLFSLDDFETLSKMDNVVVLYDLLLSDYVDDEFPLNNFDVESSPFVDTNLTVDFIARYFSKEIDAYISNDEKRDDGTPVGLVLFLVHYGTVYRYIIKSYLSIEQYVCALVERMTDNQIIDMINAADDEAIAEEQKLDKIKEEIQDENEQAQQELLDILLSDEEFAKCTNKNMRQTYCSKYFDDELWIRAFSRFNKYADSYRSFDYNNMYNFINNTYQRYVRKR